MQPFDGKHDSHWREILYPPEGLHHGLCRRYSGAAIPGRECDEDSRPHLRSISEPPRPDSTSADLSDCRATERPDSTAAVELRGIN